MVYKPAWLWHPQPMKPRLHTNHTGHTVYLLNQALFTVYVQSTLHSKVRGDKYLNFVCKWLTENKQTKDSKTVSWNLLCTYLSGCNFQNKLRKGCSFLTGPGGRHPPLFSHTAPFYLLCPSFWKDSTVFKF